MVQVQEGSCCVLHSTKQRWIQDFPGEKGHQPHSGLRQPITCKVFAENCMKMKENGPSLSPPPPFGSATARGRSVRSAQTIDEPEAVCEKSLFLKWWNSEAYAAIISARERTHEVISWFQPRSLVTFYAIINCLLLPVSTLPSSDRLWVELLQTDYHPQTRFGAR